MKWTVTSSSIPFGSVSAEPTIVGPGPDVGAEVRRGAASKEAIASVQEAGRQLGLRGGDVGVVIAGRRPSDDGAQLAGERRLGCCARLVVLEEPARSSAGTPSAHLAASRPSASTEINGSRMRRAPSGIAVA